MKSAEKLLRKLAEPPILTTLSAAVMDANILALA
jgi:hypothetical protein